MSDIKPFTFNGNRDQSLAFLDWLEGIGYTFAEASTFDVTPDRRPLNSFDGLRDLARDLKPATRSSPERSLYITVPLPFEDWVLARLKFGKR